MKDNIKKKIEEIIIEDSFLSTLKNKIKGLKERKAVIEELNKYQDYNIENITYLPKGTYFAERDIYVDEHSRFIIGEGTTILFDENSGIISHGTLQFLGTEENPIIFAPIKGHWKGINIYYSKKYKKEPRLNELLYCGIYGVIGNPGLSVMKHRINIQNCVISDNMSGGIYAEYSGFWLEKCLIENNRSSYGGGIHLVDCYENSVSGNLIKNNQARMGGGLIIKGSGTIKNNTFVNNQANMGSASYIRNIFLPTFKNNTILNNKSDKNSAAIHIYSNSSKKEDRIYQNNIFKDNFPTSVICNKKSINDL